MCQFWRFQMTSRNFLFTQTDFRLCPKTMICVKPQNKLGNICHMDDGGPLYQLECGSTEAKCLYGVASFSLGRTSTPRHRCNSGSYFTKVAQYYEWVQQMLFRHS
ncbi:uncharacterized protein LOC142352085 [Convolutriloba macropyga]|uniref:uncharacterized protein LOC142352085 n=1 Tax=Convolutriloba macropyga TaxID=536237 RepID=UPI003F52492C